MARWSPWNWGLHCHCPLCPKGGAASGFQGRNRVARFDLWPWLALSNEVFPAAAELDQSLDTPHSHSCLIFLCNSSHVKDVCTYVYMYILIPSGDTTHVSAVEGWSHYYFPESARAGEWSGRWTLKSKAGCEHLHPLSQALGRSHTLYRGFF